MPPPRHQPPDPYEQEYAIRDLVKGLERLTDLAQENAKDIARLKEAELVWKTKWAMINAIVAVVIAIAMKFLPLHL